MRLAEALARQDLELEEVEGVNHGGSEVNALSQPRPIGEQLAVLGRGLGQSLSRGVLARQALDQGWISVWSQLALVGLPDLRRGLGDGEPEDPQIGPQERVGLDRLVQR